MFVIRLSRFILDPGVMGVENYDTNEYAIVSVECLRDSMSEQPFSRCANGCPVYPDSSIKISQKKKELCEGDTFFVFKKRCEITSMRVGNDN